jgi:hypothetical protein
MLTIVFLAAILTVFLLFGLWLRLQALEHYEICENRALHNKVERLAANIVELATRSLRVEKSEAQRREEYRVRLLLGLVILICLALITFWFSRLGLPIGSHSGVRFVTSFEERLRDLFKVSGRKASRPPLVSASDLAAHDVA